MNNMKPLDADRVIELWTNTDLTNNDICEALNCSFTKVRAAAGRLGLELARKGSNRGRR